MSGVDAEWDSQTYLARPNAQARTGTRSILFFVQLTASRISNQTRLVRNLLKVITADAHPQTSPTQIRATVPGI